MTYSSEPKMNLAQAEWAAGQWMSVALRRMAADEFVMAEVRKTLGRKYDAGLNLLAEDVIDALADYLEGRSG